MNISHKYRLLPTSVQHKILQKTLEEQRILYNVALEERIGCYRVTGKSLSLYDQCKSLTTWRQSDQEAAKTPPYFQRWTLTKLSDSYNAFFDRVKQKQPGGFPRYRSRIRWKSFGFAAPPNGNHVVKFDGKRLRWRTMPGGLRVHLHRQLPENASIRTFVISRDLKGWSISFQLKCPDVEKHPIEKIVGIDVGLNVFACQSDNIAVPNPRIARRHEKEMRRRQRALARCKRGSRRREKIKQQVTQLHDKIMNTRSTFLHQQSARVVRDYDLIAVEDLKVANMVRHPTLARSILDASWSKFVGYLSYKAEGAGKTLVKVDPKNTTKMCFSCKKLVPKTLAVRIHSCPSCGFVLDRDYNASLNILHQAVVGLGDLNVAQWGMRDHRKIVLEGISK